MVPLPTGCAISPILPIMGVVLVDCGRQCNATCLPFMLPFNRKCNKYGNDTFGDDVAAVVRVEVVMDAMDRGRDVPKKIVDYGLLCSVRIRKRKRKNVVPTVIVMAASDHLLNEI